MRRHTPLRTYTTLRRHVPLLAKAAPKRARVRPAVPDDVRTALAARSGGWCEFPACTQLATDPHHRKARKIGGRRGDAKKRLDQLANLVHLCRGDHTWVTGRVAEAVEMGLVVSEYDDPAQVPVQLRYGVVYLDNAGGVHSYEEAGL